MTYNELKQIAQPHIRKGSNLPSNPFLLLVQLHIPFKTKKQCEEDFEGKMSPLYNTPAFLSLDRSGGRIIYFNPDTKYCDFYIFHEISHYILGHETDSPQNEMDADLLACILMAPVENFPSNIKSARDISTICGIPIDKAEMYWQEVRKEVFPFRIIIPIVAVGIIALILSLSIFFSARKDNATTKINTPSMDISPPVESVVNPIVPTETSTQSSFGGYYVTVFGTKYHEEDCRYLKGKANITYMTLEEATNSGFKPCKVCIK